MLCGKLLPREFYLKDTLTVAKELIGCRLVVLKQNVCACDYSGGNFTAEENSVSASGIITESEAYLGLSDKACHSYKGKPGGRTNIMYNEGGYAYVYLIYGMYNCFNIVTGKEGEPEAVLIRAIEDGGKDPKKYSGPGKLCREAGITRADYGADLCAEQPSRIIVIKPHGFTSPNIIEAKRVGVEYAGEAADYLYRFYDGGSKSVSKRVKA